MQYIKFGFGRATTDASIDIRSGKMSRSDGIALVKKYDNLFPKEYLNDYLEYFDMGENEFDVTCENFRNMDLFEMKNGNWYLKDCI